MPPWGHVPPASPPQSPTLRSSSSIPFGAAIPLFLAFLSVTASVQADYSTRNTGASHADVIVRTADTCIPSAPGLFCGGGHTNLRDPWVPYPTPPSRAPDGFPFGPVGAAGAQGGVGAAYFPQGANTSTGTWPCGTAACITTISSNTVWGNVSITLRGNVTINGPASLLVYNSKLTYIEPAVSTRWAYGFNVSANAAQGRLVFAHGSTLTQSSSTTRGLFVVESPTWAGHETFAQNLTVNATSTNPCLLTIYPSCRYFTSLLWIDLFNYSTFNGPGVTNWSIGSASYAYHSLLRNGASWYGGSNNTFNRANVGGGGGAGSWTGPAIAYDTFANVTPKYSVAISYAAAFGVNHARVENSNTSAFGVVPSTTGLALSVQNSTAANDWCDRTHVSFNRNPLFGSLSTEVNGTANHNSFVNVSARSNCGWVFFGSNTLGIHYGGASAQFNLGRGYRSYINYSAGGVATEGGPLWLYSFHAKLNYNVFRDWLGTPTFRPLWTNQVFSTIDQGNQIYNVVADYCYAGATEEFRGNWLINASGQTWATQVHGCGGVATGNTIVNATTGGGIGISVNSGCNNSYVANNSAVGLYNFSFGIGSNEGGAIGTTYVNNSGADVDVTSWTLWTATSFETWISSSGSLYLQNTNASNGGTGEQFFKGHTTRVYLVSSSVPAINLSAIAIPSFNLTRTVLPNDFNISANNSYVPGSLTSQALTLSQRTGGTAYLNPSFLTLSGFVGLFSGQTYQLNTSTFTGSSLGVDWGGSLLSNLPAASVAGRHVYTFTVTSGTQIAVGAEASGAPAVPVSFNGLLPGAGYTVTASYASNGTIYAMANYTATGAGTVSVNFLPTITLSATFSIVCGTACSLSVGAAPGFSLTTVFFGLPTYVWIGVILLAVAAISIAAGRLRV